jgi:hypothetical protein
VTVEQAINYLRLDLVRFHFRIAFLVAGVVGATGVDVGDEGEPAAIGRPDGIARARGNARDRFNVAAGGVHRVNLPAAHERDPLAVGRPARRRRGRLSARQLHGLAARDRDQVNLRAAAIRGLVWVADLISDEAAIGRQLRVADAPDFQQIVNGQRTPRRLRRDGVGGAQERERKDQD